MFQSRLLFSIGGIKMSDGSMEQVQNRVNSDLRRQFRSFRGFIKKPKKAWSAPTLKWFSLYSIGILAGMWAFILDWTKLEPWIGIAITVGISVIIVVSILFIENARAAKGCPNPSLCECPYIYCTIASDLHWIGQNA